MLASLTPPATRACAFYIFCIGPDRVVMEIYVSIPPGCPFIGIGANGCAGADALALTQRGGTGDISGCHEGVVRMPHPTPHRRAVALKKT